MSAKIIAVSIAALMGLSACSTTKESPIYQQSTKYKVHTPSSAQTSTATTSYATYQNARALNTATTSGATSSNTYYHNASTGTYQQTGGTVVNHECLDKEGNRKMIGTGAGAVIGGLAGNELIGGTKGAVIGAVAGGAAGYGIADVSIKCDALPVASQPATTYPVTTSSYPAATTTTYPATTSYPATSQTQTVYSDSSQIYTAPQTQTTSVTASNTQTSTMIGEAPTDSAYDETFGTPGYHAMQANGELDGTQSASVTTTEPDPAPVAAPAAPTVGYPQYTQPAPAPAPVPAPVQPSYPQYTAPAPQPAPYQTAQAGVTTHQVVEGDTVYSLSRKLCVGVEDIRNLNNLNGEFYIRLDDYIKLPASRC